MTFEGVGGSEARSRLAFRPDINGLRAVAVALVVLFHFKAPGFQGGFLGVDVFFVISGYLMTKIIGDGLERASFSFLKFYKDRFARIVPALAVMVATVLAFGLFFVHPDALVDIGESGASSMLFVSNVQYWITTGYFDKAATTKWLLHTWSLSVEWWFYIIYPVVLALAWSTLKDRRKVVWVLAVLFAASLTCAIVCGMLPGRLYTFGFYMLPARAWEMLAGGVVALRPVSFAKPVAARWAAAAGAGLLLVGVVALDENDPWPSAYALLPVLGACLIIASGAASSVLGWRPLQAIGSASYSIYLWHWPIVVMLHYFGHDQTPFLVAGVAGSIALGLLSLRFIERPAQRAIKYATGWAPSAVGIGGAAALVAVAFGVAQAHGFPERIRGDRALYADVDAAMRRTFDQDGCGSGLSPVTGRLRPSCTLGVASAHDDVVVFGDSFAEMSYARVKAIERQIGPHGVTFVTKGGCPPVPGYDLRQPGSNCSAFHAAALRLVMSPRYGSVVYIAMWPTYFPRGQGGGTLNARDAEGRLLREIRDLQATGRHVTVVTTFPYPDVDFPERLRRVVFEGSPIDPSATFDFKAVQEKSFWSDEFLKRLASIGVTVVDPAAQLCRAGACPLLSHGRTIYYDHAHMRSEYVANHMNDLDPLMVATPAAARGSRVRPASNVKVLRRS